MRFLLPAGLALAAWTGWAQTDSGPSVPRGNWKLVWSDEFDTPGLPDPSKWDYEEGLVRNRELQYYTRARRENARVEDGTLILEARREDFKGARFTSASLRTLGKASWTYGRFEIKARIPTGRGLWPALWTLGTDLRRVGWPACGELDIMENVGFDPETIYATVHTRKYNHVKGNSKGGRIRLARPFDRFIVYAMEWFPDRIDFFADQEKYFTYVNDGSGADAWPFDRPQYLILNVAVGGTWGGQKGVDETVFPQQMRVDYVRVYEKQ
ncbi:MAG: family 16 glycosylhydrolase [Planctomycetota bacterium]